MFSPLSKLNFAYTYANIPTYDLILLNVYIGQDLPRVDEIFHYFLANCGNVDKYFCNPYTCKEKSA